MAIQVLPPDLLHKVLDSFLAFIDDPSYGQYSAVVYPPFLPFSAIIPVTCDFPKKD
jgi:hypothetical protein